MEVSILQAGHQRIRVSAHLEDKRGIFQIVMSWNDHTGKRCRKSTSTGLTSKGNKKRAEDMMNAVRQDQEAKVNSDPINTKGAGMLFVDYMDLWLERIKADLKPTTYGTHQSMVQRVIGPYFRERKITLSELEPGDILAFYKKQMEHVKATTVHKYHNIFSRVLKMAVEEELIARSPMEKVKRPKAEKFTGKFLRESEVIELFDAAKGHKLELGVILGAFYGLRRGEVVGLRWESIDFETNTITIEHSVVVAQVDGKKTVIESDDLKAKASFRSLPLVPSFRTKLLSLKEEQATNRRLCGKAYNKEHSGYVYVDQLGNRMRPDYLTAEFPIFMEKNNFRRMRFHDLRHSCASLLLANGVSLKEIQEWLGHSNFMITANTYAHLQVESKRAAANLMTWVNDTALGRQNPV
jgi:integrase